MELHRQVSPQGFSRLFPLLISRQRTLRLGHLTSLTILVARHSGDRNRQDLDALCGWILLQPVCDHHGGYDVQS